MTEHKLSEQELQEIREEAELLYPTVSPIRALQNRGQISCQAAYIAAATAERLRAKAEIQAYIEALEFIEMNYGDHDAVRDKIRQTLNNYNQNKEV